MWPPLEGTFGPEGSFGLDFEQGVYVTDAYDDKTTEVEEPTPEPYLQGYRAGHNDGLDELLRAVRADRRDDAWLQRYLGRLVRGMKKP
jgi:hypothetical protein